MPHIFVNRERYHSLWLVPAQSNGGSLMYRFFWESLNALTYLLGSFFFVMGSVMFLPDFGTLVNLGHWVFFIGSCMYLLVSCHDLLEVATMITTRTAIATAAGARRMAHNFGYYPTTSTKKVAAASTAVEPKIPSEVLAPPATTSDGLHPVRQDGDGYEFEGVAMNAPITSGHLFLVDTIAAVSYFFGSICYMVGRFLFLPAPGGEDSSGVYEQSHYYSGITFIVGSILFVVGSIMNSIQIFKSPSSQLAMFANLTAISDLIGSTLFLSGSVPYMWLHKMRSVEDKEILARYSAWLCIYGSVAFFWGAIFNFARAKIYWHTEVKHHMQQQRHSQNHENASFVDVEGEHGGGLSDQPLTRSSSSTISAEEQHRRKVSDGYDIISAADE